MMDRVARKNVAQDSNMMRPNSQDNSRVPVSSVCQSWSRVTHLDWNDHFYLDIRLFSSLDRKPSLSNTQRSLLNLRASELKNYRIRSTKSINK